MLVLFPALNAVKLFDKFCFFLGDSNAIPMVPFFAVVTTSEKDCCKLQGLSVFHDNLLIKMSVCSKI